MDESNNNFDPKEMPAPPAADRASHQLADLAQIRGAARMINDGTDAKDVQPEQIAGVIARGEAFKESTGANNRKIAKAIGWSTGVISDFFSGKYAGDRGQVAIDLDRWLNSEEELAARPRTTTFVWTNVAMTIRATAGYCLEGSREKRTIGLVYGPETAGIGKTLALKAIHAELTIRRSAFVTIEKVDATPTALLLKLCQAVNVESWGSNAQKFKRIADKVKGRSFIFLIDQIHNLRWAKQDKPFYLLTDLYDRTETAQLWAGTADLVAYLEQQQSRDADESRAQIRSRIFPRIDLMEAVRDGGSGEALFTVEDIRRIFAKNQLRLVSGAPRFLCQICNTPDSGALRLCVHLVEYATSLAIKRGLGSIDERILAEAMRAGFQPHRAQLILDSISVREHAVARAKAS